MEYFIYYFISINIITFLIYGMDKYKAKNQKWRISEKTLIGLAVIGGVIGAIAGMQIFRHKTKHAKFVVGVPVIGGLWGLFFGLYLGLVYFK